jgi:xylulokinase
MGETGVLLGADDGILYPMIPWNDHRAAQQYEILSEQLSPEQWFSITGLYPNPIHSVFKWRWLKERVPEVFAQPLTWLSSMGFVRYKLTGNKHFETSQAARTMAYDVKQQGWSEEILSLVGMPTAALPELVSATTAVGVISQEAAALSGLAVGTPVYAGGHDHICAALACGVITPDIALDSFGTAEGLTFGAAGRPQPQQAGGFAVGPHVIEGYRYYLGGIYSSGGTVDWLRKLFQSSFADLTELMHQVKPGDAPLFIPHFYGAAPPFTQAEAEAAFLDIKPHHDRAHFVRAVYEGIAFEIRRHLEAFEALTQQPLRLVRVVGNPTSDATWLRMRADILGKALELPEQADMVTLGAAMIAGLGHKLYADPNEAIAMSYRATTGFQPDPDQQAHYAPRYARYVSQVARLSGKA